MMTLLLVILLLALLWLWILELDLWLAWVGLLWILCAAALLCVPLLAHGGTGSVTIAWRAPDYPAPLTYNVYGTQDLAAPIPTWPLLTNVATTNVTLPVSGVALFVTVTALSPNGKESGYATR